MLKVFKVGQTTRSRSQGQKSRSQMKGVITRNLHVKYESLTTYSSRDIAKGKDFLQTDRQTDR